MGEEFFIIKSTADGTTFDGPLTRETLEKRLAENYYGPNKRFAAKNPGTDGFCFRLDDDELLVIRGNIVQPKPSEVVTRWQV